MNRVTADNLRALLDAINFVETAAEGADEGAYVHGLAQRAGVCYDWILREIRRREARKKVRVAVKDAETYLRTKEHSTNPET